MAPPCATLDSSVSVDSCNLSVPTCAIGSLGCNRSDTSSTSISSSSSFSTLSGSDEDLKNSTNIYVSELPPTISAKKFQWLFAPFGVIVSARLVPRRKGFLPVGFVQYTTPEAAQAAIAMMNHTKVMGATISVRLARRDKDKDIESKPSTTLYVANLPPTYSEADLRLVFSPYGAVKSALIFRHLGATSSKGGAGLVRFMEMNSAIVAKEALQCTLLPGHEKPLEVKFAESKHDKELRHEGRKNLSMSLSKPKDLPVPQEEEEEIPLLPQVIVTADVPSSPQTTCQPFPSPSSRATQGDDLAMRVFLNCLQFLQFHTPRHEVFPEAASTYRQVQGFNPAEMKPIAYELFPQGSKTRGLSLLGGIMSQQKFV